MKAWAGTLVVLATPIGLLATSPQPAAANCDIPGNIAISDARVYEGTGPYPLFSVLAFRVTSSGNATSIDYAATRMVPPPGLVPPPGWGAATPGDYIAESGTIALDGNPKTLSVLVRHDATTEPNEMMAVRLFNPKGCFPNIADGVGIGRIYNDD